MAAAGEPVNNAAASQRALCLGKHLPRGCGIGACVLPETTRQGSTKLASAGASPAYEGEHERKFSGVTPTPTFAIGKRPVAGAVPAAELGPPAYSKLAKT